MDKAIGVAMCVAERMLRHNSVGCSKELMAGVLD